MIVLLSSTLVFCVGFYHATTYGVSLSEEKFEKSKGNLSIKIYDINGNQIKLSSENYIPIQKLSTETKNAFICAEDKRFYSHKGVDYIRMTGAMINNLKSHSFSEGASTISQQLIKNTHLSSEKTITRKLKEIKLSKKLEQKYSKDEILELYLNNIYFGNGCYGIENASKHYFNKSASKLTLSESALLAGSINAPSVYDIENNPEKALSRRNLILKLMTKYGKISLNKQKEAENEKIELKLTKLSNNNIVWGEIIEEACKITGKTENELKNTNIKIYSYIDCDLQNQIANIIESSYSKLPSNPSVATIVIDNKTNGIVALSGSKRTLKSRKQPGSLIKPLLVYGPAIENGTISPATKILDEKININGYQPENADKKYHGYVSVRECLKNSYNIPAVKLLNEIGINNAQNFAKNLGIKFDENDNNLAIALGGFTKGATLIELADAYSALANGGNFSKSNLISKIVIDDTITYQDEKQKTSAMSLSTAYMLTDILKDTAKSGTARRLKSLNFDVASKTGTVGSPLSSKNIESFNAAYTSNHTILTYIGGTTMPESINGATYTTMLAKDILEHIYADTTPPNFKIPSTIETKQINKELYQKNIVAQTDDNKNSITEIFSTNNLPTQSIETLNLKLKATNIKGSEPTLQFFASPNYSYKIFRKSNKSIEIIETLEPLEIEENYIFEDKTAKNNQIYEYFVEICEKSTNNKNKTNSIKLKTF
jgi:membrane peptidoglycan carboxypeptidase